jgi:AGZA family xanthine/uracil permease-like MFS transporter
MPDLREAFHYRWAARGDINGFFALAIDNMALLVAMSGILIGVFRMPPETVLGGMVPGTAVGVLAGDLLYSWLAFRLARSERRQDVCAMPLGIDTPSMFALSFGVVGPAYLLTHDAHAAWVTGMAVVVVMGAAKLIGAFFGDALRWALPRTALLAALSAVALALILYLPFMKIFAEPVGGLVALGVILITLVGKMRLPGGFPVVIASVLAGLAAWALARVFGYVPPALPAASPAFGFYLPLPSLAFVEGVNDAGRYIPLAIPLAIVTVIGGIDNTESAAVAGDRYATRSILLVEGAATLLAGLCGGVIQNTPYIGHPAYKEMGSRAAYTIATAAFIGVGAATGLIGMLIAVLPESVVVPVLVFVGLEMGEQAMATAERRHLRAVAIALVPAMANLVNIQIGNLLGAAHLDAAALSADLRQTLQVSAMLGNGFIVTAMLWSAWLIWVIDHQFGKAAGVCWAAAALTLFGLIHSPFADGRLFLPWDAGVPAIVFALAAGYALLAGICLLFGLGARNQAKDKGIVNN